MFHQSAFFKKGSSVLRSAASDENHHPRLPRQRRNRLATKHRLQRGDKLLSDRCANDRQFGQQAAQKKVGQMKRNCNALYCEVLTPSLEMQLRPFGSFGFCWWRPKHSHGAPMAANGLPAQSGLRSRSAQDQAAQNPAPGGANKISPRGA